MDVGINFRDTSGFVTDGAGETYWVLDTYPTTRGGATFGTEVSGWNSRDRNAAADRRLAGNAFVAGSGGDDWRLDLPAAGSYDIHLAAGDINNVAAPEFTVRDGTTTLLTITGSTGAAGSFRDATNVIRSNWPGTEVASTQTFATTILRLRKTAGAGDETRLAHLRVVTAAAGGTVIPVVVHHRKMQGAA